MAGKVTLSHKIEYVLTRLTGFFLSVLPLRCALACGALLGRIAWSLGVRGKVSRINISTAFPEKTSREVDRIGSSSYANSGRFMVEFIRQGRMGRKYFEKYITVEKTDALEKTLKHTTGIIGLTFHFGNWEYYGASNVFLGKDISFLVGRQRNSLVDGYINRLRSSQGPRLLTRDVSMRGIIRIARQGGIVCWLSDQSAGRNGLVVDFFGKPASTPRGAAAFSVKLNMPITCGFMIREKGPYQRFVVKEFLMPDRNLPKHEAEVELTQRYTKVLEGMIKEYPELYWWSHRRWKKTTDLY
ncbi:MAG: lysophospholipid acyltransferase family protein [Candidatus Sabulitectum sp.]|nr:lysophospholipid acyltransferase family protein [Candidatus Sabulitectum sp.]